MEALVAIMTRKSVREFGYKPMPDDALKKLLAAGMQAPTARNGQPWHFVVVSDREMLLRIPEFSPYTKMVAEASAGILVCGDTQNERSREYVVQDCAAATENILLAAHAMGMGGVWTGVYPDEKKMEGFRKLLGIPAHIAPVSFAVIGFPKAIGRAEMRYNGERVHRGKW
ncbi:MAG: nitroreductase family protein [Candidatus Micrarchaeota archaeon]|nr:nitroreductase family protein [Candidatus Micrarchaeota archaeon]